MVRLLLLLQLVFLTSYASPSPFPSSNTTSAPIVTSADVISNGCLLSQQGAKDVFNFTSAPEMHILSESERVLLVELAKAGGECRAAAAERGPLRGEERNRTVTPLLSAGWTYVPHRDAIYKQFIFHDINEAFGFMTRVDIKADGMGHHPEWFNVYNKVQVTLSTHDVGGLSDKDVTLATFMEEVAKTLLP
ncbi:hypothetical protein ACOMHN_029307 [Nucella lapillus]